MMGARGLRCWFCWFVVFLKDVGLRKCVWELYGGWDPGGGVHVEQFWNKEPEVKSDCDGACTEFYLISVLVLETSTEIVREASKTSEVEVLQSCVHLVFILKCK